MSSKTRVILNSAVVNSGSLRCIDTELFPEMVLEEGACRDFKVVVTSTTTTRTP